MLNGLINYVYIIFVPIIAIAGTAWYMNSHTTLSTGPESEAKGCLGVFITSALVGVAVVTFAIYALAWCVAFFLEHWKWFAGGAVVLIALLVWGSKENSAEKKVEANE